MIIGNLGHGSAPYARPWPPWLERTGALDLLAFHLTLISMAFAISQRIDMGHNNNLLYGACDAFGAIVTEPSEGHFQSPDLTNNPAQASSTTWTRLFM